MATECRADLYAFDCVGRVGGVVTAFASGPPIAGKRRISTRTYREYILRLICRVSFEMPEIINTCFHLNSETEYSNFKDLILVSPRVARDGHGSFPGRTRKS